MFFKSAPLRCAPFQTIDHREPFDTILDKRMIWKTRAVRPSNPEPMDKQRRFRLPYCGIMLDYIGEYAVRYILIVSVEDGLLFISGIALPL